METHTYKNVRIRQKGATPDVGDEVENVQNGRISIPFGEKETKLFDVRDGVITQEVKGLQPANMIVGVIFVLMMLLMIFFIWLWAGAR